LELVSAFTNATGIAVAYRVLPRRQGDVASCFAATDLAQTKLQWRAVQSLQAMCADAWRWEQAMSHSMQTHA